MSKKVQVYQKIYKLVAECDTLLNAKKLVKEIKINENINSNKDFRII